MRFLKDEDYHGYRVLICTIFLVAIYMLHRNTFTISECLGCSFFMWLYYCIAHVFADLYTDKNIK